VDGDLRLLNRSPEEEGAMAVFSTSFTIETRGETDIIDITDYVEDALARSGLTDGTATLFVNGSTAGLTTLEFESGLLQDLREAFERAAPRNALYAHNERWGDGNGYAHIRASLTGQDMSIPFSKKKLILGTWQQVILVDFDNRPRRREITVQVIGE
jgi:secondary thiamine-phosphate synthase enzyme